MESGAVVRKKERSPQPAALTLPEESGRRGLDGEGPGLRGCEGRSSAWARYVVVVAVHGGRRECYLAAREGSCRSATSAPGSAWTRPAWTLLQRASFSTVDVLFNFAVPDEVLKAETA